MKKFYFFFLCLLSLPAVLLAEGPYLRQQDSIAQQEFDHVYQDIRPLYARPRIIQIVQSTTTTSFSTTSNTFQTTNLSASITPNASTNKIFVMAYGVGEVPGAKEMNFSLFRGSTNLGNANGFGDFFTTSGGATDFPVTLIYLDSPATTSSTTYAVKIKNTDGSSTVTFGVSTNYLQSMVLVEVQP